MIIIGFIIISIGITLMYYSRKLRLNSIRNHEVYQATVTRTSMISTGHMENRHPAFEYSYKINDIEYNGQAFGKQDTGNSVTILINKRDCSESLVFNDIKTNGFIFISRLLGLFIFAIGLAIFTISLVTTNSD
jgi:hypothetical protein